MLPTPPNASESCQKSSLQTCCRRATNPRTVRPRAACKQRAAQLQSNCKHAAPLVSVVMSGASTYAAARPVDLKPSASLHCAKLQLLKPLGAHLMHNAAQTLTLAT